MLIKRSVKKLALTLAGTIASCTALFAVSIPKSPAAVLTYNIQNTGIQRRFTGLTGYFKVDYLPSELSQAPPTIIYDGDDEIYLAWTSVKEGTLYDRGIVRSFQNFPQSIQESFISDSSHSFNLAGKPAMFFKSKYGADPWKLAGLLVDNLTVEKTWQGEGPNFLGNNDSIPILAQWSRKTTIQYLFPLMGFNGFFVNEVIKRDELKIEYPGGSYSITEVNAPTNSDKAYISYELVSQSDSGSGEPVPEPMTVVGTALAIAGFAAWKRMKKTAC